MRAAFMAVMENAQDGLSHADAKVRILPLLPAKSPSGRQANGVADQDCAAGYGRRGPDCATCRQAPDLLRSIVILAFDTSGPALRSRPFVGQYRGFGRP